MVTMKNPIKVHRRFEEASCLHVQGRRVRQASNPIQGTAFVMILADCSLGLRFNPEDGGCTFLRTSASLRRTARLHIPADNTRHRVCMLLVFLLGFFFFDPEDGGSIFVLKRQWISNGLHDVTSRKIVLFFLSVLESPKSVNVAIGIITVTNRSHYLHNDSTLLASPDVSSSDWRHDKTLALSVCRWK
jgi:hypothetical protein